MQNAPAGTNIGKLNNHNNAIYNKKNEASKPATLYIYIHITCIEMFFQEDFEAVCKVMSLKRHSKTKVVNLNKKRLLQLYLAVNHHYRQYRH